jgi:aldehyde:ferredoxin oxidoreductase
MKQTAVEWLEQQLYKAGWEQLNHEEKMNICCTAKMMEKEHISDKVLFEQATVSMEEHYGYDCETEIDAYFRGAKWMQKQFIKNTEQ